MKFQQKFDTVFSKLMCLVLAAGGVAAANPCLECNQLRSSLRAEETSLKTYQNLKKRNEDYLKKSDIPSSAVIKVQSNLLLINIKIETANNKIEAMEIQKKNLGECVNCPV